MSGSTKRQKLEYVRFKRNDSSEGISFRCGEVHRVSETFTGMVRIGSAHVWLTSIEPATESDYHVHTKKNGMRSLPVSSGKKSKRKRMNAKEHTDGKELTLKKKNTTYLLYSVENGKTPKDIDEAKKLLGIKRGQEFDILFMKTDKLNFAVRKGK